MVANFVLWHPTFMGPRQDVSCLPSGTYNFEVASKFFKNVCEPA